MIRSVLRRLRTSTPAKVTIALAVILLVALQWHLSPHVTLSDQQLEAFWAAPRDEAAQQYETRRKSLLEQQRYDAHSTSWNIRSPPWTADGQPALHALPEDYASRLGSFVFRSLNSAPMRSRLVHAVGRVHKQVPPTTDTFPLKLYSADRFGDAGVPDMFRLWNALLPIPLGGQLDDLLPQTEWADPARRGSPWSVIIADGSDMDTELSAWIGDSISMGNGEWARFWDKVATGSHRSQVFSFMSALFEGGLFAASDTMPIAHPFMWGLGAKSILHPDLEMMKRVLMKHAASSDSTHRRLWDRSQSSQTQTNWTVPEDVWDQPWAQDDVVPPTEDNNNKTTWEPRYPSSSTWRLARRAPFFGHPTQPDEATSILSPEINLVVAIDWDSSLAFKPAHWAQWSFRRLSRSLSTTGPGRSLQFSTSNFAAKPYHPVFLDTVATIWENVEADGLAKQDPVDLSGSGPFTDAVLRYLLVRYGVTPSKLRGLNGPVRIGDVLILQEQALAAPEEAKLKMLDHVQHFFPMLPGSGVAQAVPDQTLWYWGAGFKTWSSGGRRVASHVHRGDEGDTPSWNDD